MILRGARIAGQALDVRIDDGVIAEIGMLAPRGNEILDLAGRWLTPGLWDNHVHFGQVALQAQRLDVSPARSAAEVAHLIAEALGQGARSPLVAVGFHDGLWPDQPNRAVLDAVSAAPIVALSGDLHSVWLNSAALALYGHSGHETGLLREGEAFRILGFLDAVDDAQLDAWVDTAARAAAARGIVGIVDYEMSSAEFSSTGPSGTGSHPMLLDSWIRRQAAGSDSLRVEVSVYPHDLEHAIERGLRTGDRLGALLTMGNLKILIDGSLNTRTAYCWDEYAGSPGEYGVLTVPEGRLRELLSRASSAGIEASVHAIGDRANTVALNAFEAVGCGGRIEHAQFLAATDLPRFARLGVAASVQPDHAMEDRDVADRYWAGRTDRAFPLRSLVDAGAELLFGSDAPVSPLDPWRTIAAAIGRSRERREAWHPEQAVTVAEAIAASTRSTIAVGQPADLVVTELDPSACTVDELGEMPVFATILGGRVTYGGRATG
jgi:predicted amidohydrolase YtcJ